MREIKFRAWDDTSKEMHFFRFGEQSSCDGTYQKNTMPLMQYTGLKDKNGKEIYEGDIVKAPHDFGPGGFSERQFTVFFNNVAGGYQWNYWDMSKAEIIGNIYEDGNLLND